MATATSYLEAMLMSGGHLAFWLDEAQKSYKVGRHVNNDIVISTPTVSRWHARIVFPDIRYVRKTWSVEPLKAETVIVRANVRMKVEKLTALNEGDRIIMGDASLQFGTVSVRERQDRSDSMRSARFEKRGVSSGGGRRARSL